MKTRGSLARRVAVDCGPELASGVLQLAGMVWSHLSTAAARSQNGVRPLSLIGIGGSVAAGKTTLAQALCEQLARDTGKQVAVVGTDGFLYPDSELERRGLLEQKGFPATYDETRLAAFVDALDRGDEALQVPVYCHRSRAVTHHDTMARPDVLIVEGVIALRAIARAPFASRCAIYLQAPLAAIESWYLERCLRLRRARMESTGADPALAQELFEEKARSVWLRTNLVNLVDHIRPGRRTADLVVHKRGDHSIERVWLRALADES